MGRARTATTWYQPLQNPDDIALALGWSLGRPGIFVISAGDVELLAQVLAAADRFQFQGASSDAAMQEMVARLEMEPLFV